MYPVIKIKLNKALDQKTCFNFINNKYAGIDFGEGIVLFHNKLRRIRNLPKNKLKKEIVEYIDYFYKKNHDALREAQRDFLRQWLKIEKIFFANVNKIFGNHKWSKGKYICYISIFPCNPRFLNAKIFQVFYKNKEDANRIICHEMLHFIFYDYWENYSKKNKIKIGDKYLWEISEIFNTVIFNKKEFKVLIKPSKEEGYPEHEKKTSDVKIVLKGGWDIKDFLKILVKQSSEH